MKTSISVTKHSFLLLDCRRFSYLLHSLFHSIPSHVTDPRCSFYKPYALLVQGIAQTALMLLFNVDTNSLLKLCNHISWAELEKTYK